MNFSFSLAYRTDEGKPWILPIVNKVETQMAQDKTLNHEYLGIDGMRAFTDAACKLLLGADSPAITDNRVSNLFLFGLKMVYNIAWSFDSIFVSRTREQVLVHICIL